MNKILQWEPEKSRVLANARIENIHRLREDLGTLADWIKEKADAAALAEKADQSRLEGLAKDLASVRGALETFRQKSETTAKGFGDRLARLDQWTSSSDGILEECRRIESTLRQLETETREQLTNGLAAAEAQAAIAREASEASAQRKTECAQLSETLQDKAREATATWEETRGSLAILSSSVEQNASKVSELTRTVERAVVDAQAHSQEVRELRKNFEAQQSEALERFRQLLRETEAQAALALQHSQATTSASERAGSLTEQCDGLIQTLQLKSEELSSTWQSLERDFSELSNRTQQDAAKAAEAAQACQGVLQECLATVKTDSEARAVFQSSGAEVKTDLSRLGELVREVEKQATRAGDYLKACEKLETHVAQTQAQTRTLAQTVQEQLRATEAQALEFQDSCRTFFGRIKWLLFGSGT